MNKKGKLILIGLSTCGFCKKAHDYLTNREIEFTHVLIDHLSSEEKSRIKREFKEKYAIRLSYPTLVINDEEYLVGYNEFIWDKSLGDLD